MSSTKQPPTCRRKSLATRFLLSPWRTSPWHRHPYWRRDPISLRSLPVTQIHLKAIFHRKTYQWKFLRFHLSQCLFSQKKPMKPVKLHDFCDAARTAALFPTALWRGELGYPSIWVWKIPVTLVVRLGRLTFSHRNLQGPNVFCFRAVESSFTWCKMLPVCSPQNLS